MIGIGIAVAGYFIGEGLKNFKNQKVKSIFESLDEDNDHELIHEKAEAALQRLSFNNSQTLHTS